MKLRPATLILLALAVLLSAGGCAYSFARGIAPEEGGEGTPPISPTTRTEQTEVTLFFADSQAQHVIPEVRLVDLQESLGEAVVRELIKGPAEPDLFRTIPEGTRLLSFEVVEGVAYVNFSRELQANHGGGSAGEVMTLDSLVLSLTELPEIDKVQILVEGEKKETLKGHFEILEPLDRGPIKTYHVFMDARRQERLQGLVDAGEQTWRLEPLEVARREGRMAGFTLDDHFELLSKAMGEYSGTYQAMVAADHEGRRYLIQLIQSVKVGDGGIWAINSIREE